MKLFLKGVVFWVGLISLPAQASYRVYQLKLSQFDRRGRILKIHSALSSVDHLQWEHLYGGYRWTKVELVDTWYCPGDTSRRAYCPKPKGIETRGPASTLDKRVLPYNRQPVIP